MEPFNSGGRRYLKPPDSLTTALLNMERTLDRFGPRADGHIGRRLSYLERRLRELTCPR